MSNREYRECALTNEPCPIADEDSDWTVWLYAGDSCESYDDSSHLFTPDERNEFGGRGKGILDDTCRYFGIERSHKLHNPERWVENGK